MRLGKKDEARGSCKLANQDTVRPGLELWEKEKEGGDEQVEGSE